MPASVVIGIIGLLIAAAGTTASIVTSAQARSAQERAAQKMKDQADVNAFLTRRANLKTLSKAQQAATRGMATEAMLTKRAEWQAKEARSAVKAGEIDLNIPRPERTYGDPSFRG